MFHLGEVLWQLGLADEAVRAWQSSADLDKTFSPPRLALAEVALTRGDFAVAADNATQASTSARRMTRARNSTARCAARAAAGADDVAEVAAALAAQPDIGRAACRFRCVAALAERGVAIPAALRRAPSRRRTETRCAVLRLSRMRRILRCAARFADDVLHARRRRASRRPFRCSGRTARPARACGSHG